MPTPAPIPAAWRRSRGEVHVLAFRGGMTIDETPRRPARRRTSQRAATSTQHELERYAGLFARRTQVMKSSAMRDLMAITERPEVISLAGGLPDTSTFPPESFAAVMQ